MTPRQTRPLIVGAFASTSETHHKGVSNKSARDSTLNNSQTVGAEKHIKQHGKGKVIEYGRDGKTTHT